METVGHWLGVGCVNVLHAFDPDMISIGGYPPVLEEWLLPHLSSAVSSLAQYDYAWAHRVLMAPDRLGIARGAATLALNLLLDDPLSPAAQTN